MLKKQNFHEKNVTFNILKSVPNINNTSWLSLSKYLFRQSSGMTDFVVHNNWALRQQYRNLLENKTMCLF